MTTFERAETKSKHNQAIGGSAPWRQRKSPKITRWPKHPFIFEINTWVWLQELRQAQGRSVTLETSLARRGMLWPLSALTRSGSWACGSAARPVSPSP